MPVRLSVGNIGTKVMLLCLLFVFFLHDTWECVYLCVYLCLVCLRVCLSVVVFLSVCLCVLHYMRSEF